MFSYRMCSDFDLCGECGKLTATGLHDRGHLFLRVSTPMHYFTDESQANSGLLAKVSIHAFNHNRCLFQ